MTRPMPIAYPACVTGLTLAAMAFVALWVGLIFLMAGGR